MKFAHLYQEALKNGDFPAEWVESAISYRQLKKCIKAVQRELSSIGLDAQTLGQLLRNVEDVHRSPGDAPKGEGAAARFQYSFAGNSQLPYPRLLFVVNTRNGVPLDARLSPETKIYLHQLALSRQRSNKDSGSSDGASRMGDDGDAIHNDDHAVEMIDEAEEEAAPAVGSDESDQSPLERIEIPLTTDSHFFHLLRNEVWALDELQDREQAQLSGEVDAIGKLVSTIAAPSKGWSRTDLYGWREIFDLYLQANIFFSANEKEGKTRTAAEAAKQLQWFSDEVVRRGLAEGFHRKQSQCALEKFMQFNAILLRNLKFQEINQIAMFKILKKFDKTTALGARDKFPELMASDPFLTRTMAKAVSFKVSGEVLSLVPQLDDYLYNTNLDPALMRFLKTYFPKEVKAKQKENERAAEIDLWGPGYADCTVM
ncbi:MAG: hypothetical protein M1832_002941 [Thelocarpon impressellum]|nr:MAG: hypothetical protein M1832_002941 [Thelocarpon impressellum]